MCRNADWTLNYRDVSCVCKNNCNMYKSAIILLACLIPVKPQRVAYVMPFASLPDSYPYAITADAQGNFYVANSGGTGAGISRIAPNGTVTVIIGGPGKIGNYTDGVPSVSIPYGIGLLPNGDIVYSDGGHQRVRRVTQRGVVSTITSGYSGLFGLDVDKDGTIFFVDRVAQRIYRIVGTTVTLLVGGGAGSFQDGTSSLGNPYGLKIGPNGNLYVGERDTLRVRVITKSGIVTTLPVPSNSWGRPENVFFDGTTNVHVVDRHNNKIVMVDNGVSVDLLGGAAVTTYLSVTPASMQWPSDAIFDAQGTIYICDTYNNRILRATICGYNGSQWVSTSNFCQCTTGYEFDTYTRRCAPLCSASQYRLQGVCTSCPSNAICTGSNSFICRSGFTLSANGQSCQNCPGGTYKNVNGNMACATCPVNSQCFNTHFSCNVGHEINLLNDDCVQCASGFFKSSVGNVSCSSCVSDAVCTTSAFSCNAGFTLNSGSTGCEACPVTTYKKTSGNGGCISCPANSVCFSTHFMCQAGFQLSADQLSCEACPSDKFKSNVGNNTCASIPTNSVSRSSFFLCQMGYQLNALQNGCEPCGANMFKSALGNSTCTSCPNNAVCISSGFTCHAGYQPNTLSTTCETCPSATFKPASGNSLCQLCPANAQCFGTFFTCNPGHQLNSAQNACDPCPNDFYKPNLGNQTCLRVPSNSVSFGSYFECDTGFQLNSNSTECDSCPLGTFKNSKGNFMCLTCPLSSTCNNGRTFSCAIGFEPNSQNTDCLRCPNGRYKLTEGNTGCLLCPPNSVCSSSFFVCNDGLVHDSISNQCVSRSSTTEISATNRGQTQTTQELSNTSAFYVGITLGVCGFLAGVILCMFFVLRYRKVQYIASKREMDPSETTRTYSGVLSPPMTDVNNTLVTISGGSELSIPAFLNKNYGLDYVLGSLIAKGGFGTVYECTALDAELAARAKGSKLVCKTFNSENSLAQRLFYQELSIMWFFRDHPNFAKIFAYSDTPEAIVMKYYPCGLDKVVLNKAGMPYSKRVLLKLFHEICQAIDAMHKAGFAHCDIKPPNVLIEIGPEMTPIISDFGISRVLHLHGVKAFQRVNVRGGSLAFAAPEILKQLRGDSIITAQLKQADCYSLALTLYEMLTRVHPWKFS